jgi:hypothetical protein
MPDYAAFIIWQCKTSGNNFRRGRVLAHGTSFIIEKQPSLNWKTWQKQLFCLLPLPFALPHPVIRVIFTVLHNSMKFPGHREQQLYFEEKFNGT